MASVDAIRIKEQRVSEICETVKTMKKLTINELSDLVGLSNSQVHKYISLYIRDVNPNIVCEKDGSSRTSKLTLRWVDSSADEKKEDKVMSDPTAAVAMNNVQPNAGKFKDPVKPGDIWWIDSNPSFMALILSVNKANAQILMIKEKDNYFDPETDMTVTINDGQEFYIQPYRVMSRGTRTFISKAATFGNDRLAKVLQAVGYYLCIPPVFKEKVVEVPVEKIVEKTVEVPVPVVDNSSESELVKYKADKFDVLLDAMIKGLNSR